MAGTESEGRCKVLSRIYRNMAGPRTQIKSGQQSTQQPVKEEEAAPDLPTSEGERAMFL